LTVERGRSMNHAMRATLLILVALLSIATLLPTTAQAQTRTNNTTGCQGNLVNYDPGNGDHRWHIKFQTVGEGRKKMLGLVDSMSPGDMFLGMPARRGFSPSA